MEFVHAGPAACSDRRSKYRKLVQSAGRARHRDIEVLRARIRCKESRLEACKQRSAEERASGCELCSVLQAQAFGQGAASWYLRRCSSCWQQHAKLHTQQAICRELQQRQQHRSSLLQPSQQHQGSSTALQDDQHTPSPVKHNSHTPEDHTPETGSSRRLIQALDLAANTLGTLASTIPAHTSRAKSAVVDSRSSGPARQPLNFSSRSSSRIRCPASANHSSDKRIAVQQNSTQGYPAAACQQYPQHCDSADGEQQATSRWEVDAVLAVSQALAAAGLPGTSLVSGAGPCQAADIITVAAAAGHSSCPAVDTVGQQAAAAQQLHNKSAELSQPPLGTPQDCSKTAQHTAELVFQEPSTGSKTQLQHETHPQLKPPVAVPVSRSKSTTSSSSCRRRVRPGSAPCAMQPLAGWQVKLGELEEACRKAEQLMLQAPTRAERSAALDLAVELREDIARIRQANRLQLKMQRTAQLHQGVPPAVVAAAAAVGTRNAVNSSGRVAAPRNHAVSSGAAAAEQSHVLRVSGHPGMHIQQLQKRPVRQQNNRSRIAVSYTRHAASTHGSFENLKQLPIDEWRQRRRQEAAWQAALRQELAALQAEASSVPL